MVLLIISNILHVNIIMGHLLKNHKLHNILQEIITDQIQSNTVAFRFMDVNLLSVSLY